MSLRLLAVCSAVVFVAACAPTQREISPRIPAAQAPSLPAPLSKPQPEVGTFGFNVDGMDKSVAPGDDFFRYAVGKWLDTTEIPPDRSSLGSVAVIREKAAERVRGIIEETAQANAPEGTDARKIGDYFATFMDEARIEQLGASPLQPELDAIGAIETRRDLSTVLGGSIRADVDVLNLGNPGRHGALQGRGEKAGRSVLSLRAAARAAH